MSSRKVKGMATELLQSFELSGHQPCWWRFFAYITIASRGILQYDISI